MDKVIYFEDKNFDLCHDKTYFDFLDYAFSKTNAFMLVYVNYYGKGYTKKQKYFKNVLKRFQIKSRSNPSWPGTLSTFSVNSTYKIVFYRNDSEAKAILKEASSLGEWTRGNAEDLAFFKNEKCWFYSVGHEKIAAIIHADTEDFEFLEEYGLADRNKAFVPEDDYFLSYDETSLRI